MAIAAKQKPKTSTHKKRTAAHHKQTKHYVKSYWPYIPMLLVIGLGMTLSSFMSHPRAVLGWQQNLNQEALLLATNNDRRANTRIGLTLNPQLSAAAQAKANDMVQKNYWSHVNPSGKQPWEFIAASGYQYQAVGENLAYGFTSADSVLNGWMNSPEHRANVLENTYSQVGFGVAQSPNFQGKGSQTVVVAMYGLPASNAANSALNQPISGSGLVNATEGTAKVSRMEAWSPAISGLLIGIIGTTAVFAVLLRHVVAWRKLIKRGERFVVKHPWLDVAFVVVAVSAVLLNQTAGFIR